MTFADGYARLRMSVAYAREEPDASELALQRAWFEQWFHAGDLRTDLEGPLRIVDPGWWNRQEGPDFKNAQLDFNGHIVTGDVEIHFTHGAWKQHGHHRDPRYDNVALVVVLESTPAESPPHTSAGRRIPSLLLSKYIAEDWPALDAKSEYETAPNAALTAFGRCAEHALARGPEALERLLVLAAEWRLLAKSRRMLERIRWRGIDQTLYEDLMAACGYSRFKDGFRRLARDLPYDRARQLASADPFLLEAALLQLAGLLPDSLPPESTGKRHLERLNSLRDSRLSGLRALPIQWHRNGVRPNNYPERRLAGVARFIARTAADGFSETLAAIWRQDLRPIARRRLFEGLFPRPMGFWADHCNWSGKRLDKPVAMLGASRVRSIIGNVFLPAGLAVARHHRDRLLEERIIAFYAVLPKEAANHILKVMAPRILGPQTAVKLTFRIQQGLLQLHDDWCEPNPSCRNCPIIPYVSGDD